jgi:hypothetical protein
VIYGVALAAGIIVGLAALRLYIRHDERRLAEQARHQPPHDES